MRLILVLNNLYAAAACKISKNVKISLFE